MRQPIQFRHIVRVYSDRVGRTARGILGNDQDAEEAVQDVFLKIFRGLPGFDGKCGLATWVYRITVNTCISRRRAKPRPEFPEDPVAVAEVADPNQRPDELYEQAEMRERVVQLTAQLADKEAEAIALFYLEELGYNEIAEIMQIPIGSVATVLHRGRLHLHLLLGKEMTR